MLKMMPSSFKLPGIGLGEMVEQFYKELREAMTEPTKVGYPPKLAPLEEIELDEDELDEEEVDKNDLDDEDDDALEREFEKAFDEDNADDDED